MQIARSIHSDAQLLKALQPAGVTEIYQMKLREEGRVDLLTIHVLTCNSCALPEEISFG